MSFEHEVIFRRTVRRSNGTWAADYYVSLEAVLTGREGFRWVLMEANGRTDPLRTALSRAVVVLILMRYSWRNILDFIMICCDELISSHCLRVVKGHDPLSVNA